MGKIRFAIIGGGWRAEFFLRIAREIPERFEVCSVLLRDNAKALELQQKTGVKTVCSLEDLLEDVPDFVVLSVAKPAVADYLIELFEHGVPVLCETPPATNLPDLERIWESAQQNSAKVQVAEQYMLQPLYAAWKTAVDKGMLGEISNMSISAVHGYHAVSVIRAFLKVGFENVSLRGERYSFPVRQTDSRDGIIFNGAVQACARDRLALEFESGKIAFLDFSSVQYHSFIRTRHFSVQGEMGEIDDMTIRYFNQQNQPVTAELQRLDIGRYNNNHWANHGIALNGDYIYLNPFPYSRLNDDELAVAECLVNMKKHLNGDSGGYGLTEALQDTYISLIMEQALAAPQKICKTQTQAWAQ